MQGLYTLHQVGKARHPGISLLLRLGHQIQHFPPAWTVYDGETFALLKHLLLSGASGGGIRGAGRGRGCGRASCCCSWWWVVGGRVYVVVRSVMVRICVSYCPLFPPPPPPLPPSSPPLPLPIHLKHFLLLHTHTHTHTHSHHHLFLFLLLLLLLLDTYLLLLLQQLCSSP